MSLAHFAELDKHNYDALTTTLCGIQARPSVRPPPCVQQPAAPSSLAVTIRWPLGEKTTGPARMRVDPGRPKNAQATGGCSEFAYRIDFVPDHRNLETPSMFQSPRFW
jgi:hypothetical protein